LQADGAVPDVIQASKPELRIMSYELSDYEWTAIKPMQPNKPRGVRRENDRRVLSGGADDKLAANYLAFVKLASIRIWLRANECTPSIRSTGGDPQLNPGWAASKGRDAGHDHTGRDPDHVRTGAMNRAMMG
jgi:hypothetical protein